MGSPRVKVEITGEGSGLQRAVKAAEQDVTGLKRALVAVTGPARGAAKFVGKVIGGVAHTVGSSIFGVISSGVDDVMNYERQITRLAIAQGKSNEEIRGFANAVTATSRATGIDRNDILGAVKAFQDETGNAEAATQLERFFGRAQQAIGAAGEDVAKTAAVLNKAFNIDPSGMEGAFDVLITQGKAGAVEAKDMARVLPSLQGLFTKFAGGDTERGFALLGATMQVAKGGFNTAEEAATGVNSLMGSLVRNAKKLDKHGVKVFDDDGRQRNWLAILEDMAKNPKLQKGGLINSILGDKEAIRTALELMGNMDMLRSLAAQTADGSMEKDRLQYAESAAGRLDVAMNKLKLSIVEAFTPERIKAFADAVSAVAGAVSGVLDGIRDVAAELGEEIFGESEATRIKRLNDDRIEERMAALGRSGQLGNVTEADLALFDAMARGEGATGRIQYLARGGSAERIEDLTTRAALVMNREERARQLMTDFGHGTEGSKGTTAAQLFAAAQTSLHGSDVAGSSRVRGKTAASLAGMDRSSMTGELAGAGAVFQTQDPRIFANAIAQEVRRMVNASVGKDIVLQIDGDAIAKAKANAPDHGRGH